MRKHPFLGWLGNRAMALWAERDAEHYNKKVAACADYRRDVLSLMEDDPRWQQLAVASADVIDTLGMTEEFNANLSECYDKGVPAGEYADNMVRFFTDGPMMPIVQAALMKAIEQDIAERIVKRESVSAEAARAKAHQIMHKKSGEA